MAGVDVLSGLSAVWKSGELAAYWPARPGGARSGGTERVLGNCCSNLPGEASIRRMAGGDTRRSWRGVPSTCRVSSAQLVAGHDVAVGDCGQTGADLSQGVGIGEHVAGCLYGGEVVGPMSTAASRPSQVIVVRS